MTFVSLVVPYYMVNDTVWAILSDSHNIYVFWKGKHSWKLGIVSCMYTRPLWGKQSRKSSLWTRKSPSCIILGLEPTFSFTSWQPPLCAHFWTLPIHVSPNRAPMRMHGRKDYTCLTATSPTRLQKTGFPHDFIKFFYVVVVVFAFVVVGF